MAKAKKQPIEVINPKTGRLNRIIPKGVDSEQQMIEAIQQAKGVVAVACKILGIHYSTWFRYIPNLPNLQKAYKAANEEVLDLAENRLYQFIEGTFEGATPALTLDAIKFLLLNKGKTRGYGQAPMVQIEKGVVLKANYPAVPPPSDQETEDAEIITDALPTGVPDSDSEDSEFIDSDHDDSDNIHPQGGDSDHIDTENETEDWED